MTRRWWFTALLSLAACNWDEAERTARCTREPSSLGCDAAPPDAGAGDAGAVDAGETDAGSPDAGLPDAGVDSGVDAGEADAGTPDAGPPEVQPIGLYPINGDALWVVANIGGDPVIEQRTASGAVMARPDAGAGRIASAYAIAETQWLAVLMAQGGTAHFFSNNGQHRSANLSGSIVSMFVSTNGWPTASVWSNSAGSYSQRVQTVEPPSQPSSHLGTANCLLNFLDLEVQPSTAGRVALVYDSTSCPENGSASVAEGIVASRTGGVQTITSAGLREALPTAPGVKRVGRWQGGFVLMRNVDDAHVEVEFLPWGADGGVPSDTVQYTADAGLGAGDVYEDLVALTTTGTLSIEGAPVDAGRDGTAQLYVANITEGWAVQLGPTASPAVSLVGTLNTTWVLWAPLGDGLRLTALDRLTGSPR